MRSKHPLCGHMLSGGSVWLSVMLALPFLGCGAGGPALYPVTGTVVWEDGTPAAELAGGVVELRPVATGNEDLKYVAPRREIDAEGKFALMTGGEMGVPAGDYAAIVVPRIRIQDLIPPKIVAERFMRFETSGLRVTVQPESNDVQLKVARYNSRH
jgi:hypothetical protein